MERKNEQDLEKIKEENRENMLTTQHSRNDSMERLKEREKTYILQIEE